MSAAIEAPRSQNPGMLYVTPHHLAALKQIDQTGLTDFLELFLVPGKSASLRGPDEDCPNQHKAALSVGRITVGLSIGTLDALLAALCPPTGEQPGDALRRQNEIRGQLNMGNMLSLKNSS